MKKALTENVIFCAVLRRKRYYLIQIHKTAIINKRNLNLAILIYDQWIAPCIQIFNKFSFTWVLISFVTACTSIDMLFLTFSHILCYISVLCSSIKLVAVSSRIATVTTLKLIFCVFCLINQS